jgi:hypothetical protein
MSSTDRADMHERLAELTAKLTGQKRKALHEGKLSLKLARLRFQKPLTWTPAPPTPTAPAPPTEPHVHVPPLAPTTTTQHDAAHGTTRLGVLRQRARQSAEDEKALESKEPLTASARPATLALSCHVCGHTRTLNHTRLMGGTSWKPLYCNKCSLSRKSSKWHCCCGKPWHVCTLHRSVGMAVQSQACMHTRKVSVLSTCHKKRRPTQLGELGGTAKRQRRRLVLPQGVHPVSPGFSGPPLGPLACRLPAAGPGPSRVERGPVASLPSASLPPLRCVKPLGKQSGLYVTGKACVTRGVECLSQTAKASTAVRDRLVECVSLQPEANSSTERIRLTKHCKRVWHPPLSTSTHALARCREVKKPRNLPPTPILPSLRMQEYVRRGLIAHPSTSCQEPLGLHAAGVGGCRGVKRPLDDPQVLGKRLRGKQKAPAGRLLQTFSEHNRDSCVLRGNNPITVLKVADLPRPPE